MKKIILTICLALMVFCCFAQTRDSNTKNTVASPDVDVNYRLFQTSNSWTFLKLDTRNGVITHVQYSIDGDAFEYPLNSERFAEGENAFPGRFFLYPTENSYTYILLDQIDGRVWQVQWNITRKKRGVWKISYSPFN